MTTTATAAVTRHILPGLRTQPLASYLAGLGLIRVVGEQADPAATAAWTPEGLALTTTVTDIAAWLSGEYMPTPVLSPWNNGSGFGPRDKEPLRAIGALLAHPSPRLAPLRDAIPLAREVIREAREKGWIAETAAGGSKRRVVQELRNRCPDAMVAWIDATVVLTGQDDQSFPPLLGTGGNDGRLDFSTNFHQRLLEVIGKSDSERAQSLARARDLLDGTEAEKLASAAVGQFDPGAAGGPGSSRFGAASSLVNPWEYVLLVEGALLFAASAVRRNQHYYSQYEERAAVPFTVSPSPAGSASGAPGEESRGEVWTPVWTEAFTLAEIRQLFAEARASWRGRPARRAVDFYAATRTLGVARGISEFTRYGLQRRNGLAFAAVPLDRIDVREKSEVRLAADVEDWTSRVGGGNASAAIAEARRRFDDAHLKYARDGEAMRLARMLAALTSLEQAVGRSGRARDAVLVRRPPRAREFLNVLAAHDPPGELRIAACLASCATVQGTDPAREPSRTMRQILLPIDPPGPADRGRGHWRDSAVVPGFGLRPLWQVLADVLIWRSHTAAVESGQQKFRGVSAFRTRIPVPAADLHALASGDIDEASLDLWLRACLALDWFGVTRMWRASDPEIPVPTLGLLHPLALGLTPGEARAAASAGSAVPAQDSDQDPTEREAGREPKLALRPDWAARLAAGQIRTVHAEAVGRLRQAGWKAVPAPPGEGAENGGRIAAALVPRCLNPWRVLRTLASPIPQPDHSATPESSESIDAEEQA
jgi:CRISPR-associated protein Csx17